MESITSKDGTRIGFQKSGRGPAMLLVHGTTADHSRWAGVSRELEKRFTVYAMDRRGRGASGDSPDYALEREAEDVASVIEAIDEPVAVVGHSYGAVCCLEGSLLPALIRRMVLYEPPIPTGLPMYPPGVPDRMQDLVDAGDLEPALELFFREVVRMPEAEFEQYRQLPMWARRIELAPTIPRELVIDRVYTFDSDKFSNMTVPTRLLLGGDSPPLFQRAVGVVASALPEARVTELSGQQHIAMDTDPDLFVETLFEFLVD